MKRLTTSLILLVILCLSVCSEEILALDTTYHNEKYGFSLTYPDTYKITKNQKNIALIIYLPQKGFKIYPPSIIVNVASARAGDMKLDEFLDIYYKYDKTVTSKQDILLNGIEFIEVEQVKQEKMLGFKLKLKIYQILTTKGLQIYTLTYSALEQNYDESIEQARQIMHSFEFVRK